MNSTKKLKETTHEHPLPRPKPASPPYVFPKWRGKLQVLSQIRLQHIVCVCLKAWQLQIIPVRWPGLIAERGIGSTGSSLIIHHVVRVHSLVNQDSMRQLNVFFDKVNACRSRYKENMSPLCRLLWCFLVVTHDIVLSRIHKRKKHDMPSILD